MTTPAPANPTPTPAPAEGQAATPGHEHAFQHFWEKNSRTIYLVCAVILVAIIGHQGYEAYTNYRDDAIGREFAACNTPEKLKAFAAANSGHPLAGIAKLRIADEAYAAGNYTQAASEYQAAADALKDSPFASRARLGAANSKLQAGQSAEAENLFTLISKDTSLFSAARAEATYQLATIAAAAGRNDEALKQLDMINTLAPRSTWAMRALQLRMTLPAPAATQNAPAINPTAKP